MADLQTLVAAIDGILQDEAYTETVLVSDINRAVSAIAGGIRMPDGSTSPPLPDLVTYGAINTSLTLAHVSLPADYQRKVFLIVDSTGYKISPPMGGDYYSYGLFLQQISDLRLTEAGSVYRVVVKGGNLFYQGIPTAAAAIGLHYYKKPTVLFADADIPSCIPEHLQEDLVTSWVCMRRYRTQIEDGQDQKGAGFNIFQALFFETMVNLCDHIGITDSFPEYYGSSGSEDLGICD